MTPEYPYLTQDVPDASPTEMTSEEPVQYVANISHGAVVGYKYFRIETLDRIRVRLRGQAKGRVLVKTDAEGAALGEIAVSLDTREWTSLEGDVRIGAGIHALYFCYEGEGAVDMHSFALIDGSHQ